MNIIRNIRITGFWGTRRVSIKLNPDINFFIGVNGTGKTTVINMIAAALNADFQTLDRLPFKKISIELLGLKDKSKSLIEVTKKPRERSPFPEINYRITDKTSGEIFDYSLDSFEEQLSFRDYQASARSYRSLHRRGPKPDMIEHLRRLVNISWLSIHRAEKAKSINEDRSYESSIDQKLDDLSRDFAGYLSMINRQGELETTRFQQKVFLSLISRQTSEDLFPAISTMDRKEERKALEDIFHEFHVDPSLFSSDIDLHFKMVDSARKLLEKNKPLDSNSVIALISMLRIHLVVQEWTKLLKRNEIIFEPRNTFLNTITDMFLEKKLEINERNQFVANAGSNKLFNLHQLSSGEKQLFIILGEALLQQKEPWVYIADEPELSLHVSWQSQLIDSLRKVNPNAQIIFATHSPDIVSQYDSKTIEMVKIIR